MAANEAVDNKAKDAKAAAPAAAAPKSDKFGILILGVVLMNTLAAAAIGYLVMQLSGRVTGFDKKTQELSDKFEEQKKVPPAAGKEFVPQELGVLYPLDSFLVNVSSDRGPRFLQMKVELELGAPSLEDEISLKRPALRDAIIVLLTSRTYSELREPQGMRRLRADLLRVMNNLLKTGQIREIYFTQFHFN
ncbi:flagellar basal body-associated FliL family protein [bacterium]|nr:flagellar basal body-associated FliL family protein [bacterium]